MIVTRPTCVERRERAAWHQHMNNPVCYQSAMYSHESSPLWLRVCSSKCHRAVDRVGGKDTRGQRNPNINSNWLCQGSPCISLLFFTQLILNFHDIILSYLTILFNLQLYRSIFLSTVFLSIFYLPLPYCQIYLITIYYSFTILLSIISLSICSLPLPYFESYLFTINYFTSVF